jgi:mitotic spindle assembly checkpoint protein MAD1
MSQLGSSAFKAYSSVSRTQMSIDNMDDETSSIQVDSNLEEAYDTISQQDARIKQLEFQLLQMTANYEEVTKSLKKKDRDLNSVKQQKYELEQQSEELKIKVDEVRIHYEKELQLSDMNLQREQSQVSELKRQRDLLTNESKKLNNIIREQEEQYQRKKEAVDKKYFEVEREKSKLSEELLDLQLNYRAEKSELENKIQMLQSQSEYQQSTADALRKELSRYKKRTFEVMDTGSEMDKLRQQIFIYEGQIKELQMNLANFKDNEALMPKMKGELSHFTEMEKKLKYFQRENEILKERAQNVEILREDNNNLRAAIESKDHLLSDYHKMKAENEVLTQFKLQWESAVGSLERFQSPEHVRKFITDVQRENHMLIESKGRAETELKAIQIQFIDKEKITTELREKLMAAQTEAKDAKEMFSKQERYLNLLIKERDGLQALLKSYDQEETLGNYDKVKTERINELEQTLAAKNSLLDQLQRDYKSLQDLKSKIEEDNRKLEKEADDLAERVQVLEQRLGKGDYDPNTIKVLHFRDNPMKMAKERRFTEQIEALEKENGELKEQLDIIKKSIQNSGINVSVPLEEVERYKQEIVRMKLENDKLMKSNSEHDIRMQRLQTVVQKKIQEFKEACFLLFGFQIDFDDSLGRRYRLLSMYAEKETDFLLFQLGKNSTMSMLETELSKTLQPQIQMYLVNSHSIPAFLSDLTLSLFKKRMKIKQ